MGNGYIGKILHVNLTTRECFVEEKDDDFYRMYVGGSCMGAYYSLTEMKAGIDALDPRNVLTFSTSPLTGTPISGTSRFSVTAKSPLTGTLGASEAGGFWGPELKFAGFDAIVIKGRADKPVYLWIHDGEYEVRDARHMWGKISGQAQEIIREELGDKKVRVVVIGQAAENLVRYAGITNELHHFNGRNGMGTVMGSKNLKAIAVRGTQKLEFYNPEAIKTISKYGVENIKKHAISQSLYEFGTGDTVAAHQAMSALPTRNFTSGVFDGYEKISANYMNENLLKSRKACWACAIKCKRVVEAKEPYDIDSTYGGPEYETMGSFGSLLEINDIYAICKANELCNKYTIDTISLGVTIAFAIECFEKGIITKEDTGGIELKFGDSEMLLKLVEMTSKRIGFGDILAEGSLRMAKKYGKDSIDFAMQTKGQEFPLHMPRTKRVLALAYACNPFGADHQSSLHDFVIESDAFKDGALKLDLHKIVEPNRLNFEKVKLYTYSQRLYSLLDTFDICQFCFGTWPVYSINKLMELVNAVTGWDTNLWVLMHVGERRVNLLKMFNAREGFNIEDDILPERVFEPLRGGATKGFKIDKDEFCWARDTYYKLAGWDVETGNPSLFKLEELGIDNFLINNEQIKSI